MSYFVLIALSLIPISTAGALLAQNEASQESAPQTVPCLALLDKEPTASGGADGRHCTRLEMAKLVRYLGGTGAVDCGGVPRLEDRPAALACVADELDRDSPFFAVFDVQGIDSAVAVGAVRTPGGKYLKIIWDSDITGGGGGIEGALSRISSEECERIEQASKKPDPQRTAAGLGDIPTDPLVCSHGHR